LEIAGRAGTRLIATPEGLLLPFEIAPAGDRIVAFLIDLGIIVAVSFTAFLLAILSFGVGAGRLGLAAAVLVSFLFRNFYFIALELQGGGTTVGKRAQKIRVIARDGGPLSAGSVIARNLTRDLEVFLPLTALIWLRALLHDSPEWGASLGVLWLLVFMIIPLVNRDHLRVGDLVAGTIVVRTPVSALLQDLTLEAPSLRQDPASTASAGYDFTHEQLELYGIKELQVLEELLRRAREGTVRLETLEIVCDKIQKKIGWPISPGRMDTSAFLQAFYAAQRRRLEEKLLFGTRQEEKKR